MNKLTLESERINLEHCPMIYIRFHSCEHNSIEGFTNDAINKLFINRTTDFGCKFTDIVKSEDVIGDIKWFVKEMFIDNLHPNCYHYDYQVKIGSYDVEVYNSRTDNICSVISELIKEK